MLAVEVAGAGGSQQPACLSLKPRARGARRSCAFVVAHCARSTSRMFWGTSLRAHIRTGLGLQPMAAKLCSHQHARRAGTLGGHVLLLL